MSTGLPDYTTGTSQLTPLARIFQAASSVFGVKVKFPHLRTATPNALSLAGAGTAIAAPTASETRSPVKRRIILSLPVGTNSHFIPAGRGVLTVTHLA